MMLVGDVASRTCIVVDDLADTCNTITRAAKLLKKEGAQQVYALITHGVLSGDAIEKINASQLDKVIVTNSVPQEEHQKRCPKLVVLDVGHLFAEVCTISTFRSDLNSTIGDTKSSPWREPECSVPVRLKAALHVISFGFPNMKTSS